jgi:hypothetical protein
MLSWESINQAEHGIPDVLPQERNKGGSGYVLPKGFYQGEGGLRCLTSRTSRRPSPEDLR